MCCSYDSNGRGRPSWAPSGFKYFGSSHGWLPAKNWQCGADWSIPSQCDIGKATWWCVPRPNFRERFADVLPSGRRRRHGSRRISRSTSATSLASFRRGGSGSSCPSSRGAATARATTVGMSTTTATSVPRGRRRHSSTLAASGVRLRAGLRRMTGLSRANSSTPAARRLGGVRSCVFPPWRRLQLTYLRSQSLLRAGSSRTAVRNSASRFRLGGASPSTRLATTSAVAMAKTASSSTGRAPRPRCGCLRAGNGSGRTSSVLSCIIRLTSCSLSAHSLGWNPVFGWNAPVGFKYPIEWDPSKCGWWSAFFAAVARLGSD